MRLLLPLMGVLAGLLAAQQRQSPFVELCASVPPSFPPDGRFSRESPGLNFFTLQTGRGERQHVRIPANRLTDWHEGEAERGGVNCFASARVKAKNGTSDYECPRRTAFRDRKGEDAEPEEVRGGATDKTAGTRGRAAPRAEQLWGTPHTDCKCKYNVHTEQGAPWVVIRLGVDDHNHAVDTIPRFVSSAVREQLMQLWRKQRHITASAACEVVLNEVVLAEALRRDLPPAEVEAQWTKAAMACAREQPFDKSWLPPRDFLLTPKYVTDLFRQLDNEETGSCGAADHILVQSWVAAHPELTFMYRPGSADDEVKVSGGLRAGWVFCVASWAGIVDCRLTSWTGIVDRDRRASRWASSPTLAVSRS